MKDFDKAALRALALALLDEDDRTRLAQWPEMIRDGDNDTLQATYLRAVEQTFRARELAEINIVSGASSPGLAESIKTAVLVEIWRDRLAEELAARRLCGRMAPPHAEQAVH